MKTSRTVTITCRLLSSGAFKSSRKECRVDFQIVLHMTCHHNVVNLSGKPGVPFKPEFQKKVSDFLSQRLYAAPVLKVHLFVCLFLIYNKLSYIYKIQQYCTIMIILFINLIKTEKKIKNTLVHILYSSFKKKMLQFMYKFCSDQSNLNGPDIVIMTCQLANITSQEDFRQQYAVCWGVLLFFFFFFCNYNTTFQGGLFTRTLQGGYFFK